MYIQYLSASTQVLFCHPKKVVKNGKSIIFFVTHSFTGRYTDDGKMKSIIYHHASLHVLKCLYLQVFQVSTKAKQVVLL